MSPKNRLSQGFDKKWSSYALAGGAMFALPVASNASVITMDAAIDLSVTDNGGVMSAPLDINGDNNPDFLFSVFDVLVNSDTNNVYDRGAIISPYGSNAILTSLKTSPSGFAAALSPGAYIGSGADFVNNKQKFLKNIGNDFASINVGYWPNDISQTRLVGLQFDISGTTHYGWAEVGVHLGTADLQVLQVGYETLADTPISTVPEPSSMALMLMGAAGVAALKRRRDRAN